MSKKYRKGNRILNYINRRCLVCDLPIVEDNPMVHHIETYPNITIYIHPQCHNRIHNEDKFYNLRPTMSHQQSIVAYRIYKHKDNIKKLIALNNEVNKIHRKIKL